MLDDSVLAEHDPHDLMDAEAARLEAWFEGLSDDDWKQPSACEGWNVQDAGPPGLRRGGYNAACFDEDIPPRGAAHVEGATDMNGFNALGERASRPHARGAAGRVAEGCARTRSELRGDDGQDMTTAGPYPAPVAGLAPGQRAGHPCRRHRPARDRRGRRPAGVAVAFARFALDEARPEVMVEPGSDRFVVRGRSEVVLDDAGSSMR